MVRHEEVVVKVNAMADRGVAPLVEALSEWPEVVTLGSCEGGEVCGRDYFGGSAHVCFVVGDGDGWQPLVAFVRRLSEALGRTGVADHAPFYLAVEWYNGGEQPTGCVRVRTEHVEQLARHVRQARSLPEPAENWRA